MNNLINKKIYILCGLIALYMAGQVIYGLGYRSGGNFVRETVHESCLEMVDRVQSREQNICRWTHNGCDGLKDCTEMEKGRIHGWQYLPSSGEWWMDD